MKQKRGLASTGLSLLLVAAVAVGIYKHSAIEDWLKLRNYSPAPQISSLASENTMTNSARRIFYINHPEIVSSGDVFRKDCPTYEQTIVIGCYHSDESGIFIYSVNDKRLNGVTEVTAAHEMLHGAYERLSKTDKNNVDALLQDYYKNHLRDKRVIETIKSYQKTEPNDLVNEMHSIFGTEVAHLTPQLETYYQRYFSNRQSVVGYADQYEGEFNRRINLINNYESNLAALKARINDEESDLSTQLDSVEADRATLDSLRAQNRYSEYNASVPPFNAEVDDYNRAVAELRADIARYNQLVVLHNSLAAELRSLYDSLDTNVKPQSSN